MVIEKTNSITTRNRQIDGLRGIAILLVVGYHLICRYQELFFDKKIVFIDLLGDLGVAIFLLISAFYLMNGLGQNVWRRTFKKILRLWPSYIVSLTITFFVLQWFVLPGRTTTVKDYFLNVFWVNGFLKTPYVDGAHWYITTLISLILATGIIKWFRQENNILIYIGWLGAELLFLFLDLDVLALLTGGAYAGIACIGIGLRNLYENHPKKRQWFLLIAGAFVFTAFTLGIQFWICLCAAVPIVWMTLKEKFGFLNNRVMLYMGTISYPLYLIHQNIAYVIEYYLADANGSFSYAYAVIALGVVMVMAIIIYYLVERPSQKYMLHL